MRSTYGKCQHLMGTLTFGTTAWFNENYLSLYKMYKIFQIEPSYLSSTISFYFLDVV